MPARVGGQDVEHPAQPLGEGADGVRVEDVGAEFHRSGDAGGPALLGPAFAQGEGQIHSSGADVDRQRRDLQLAQAQPRRIVAAPGQHHLNQWVVGQRSGGVEPLDQDFEGHVLVFVGGQAALAHPGQDFADGGITGQIDAQHQGVDEEPDQVIKSRVTTPGNRKTHRHITTRTELGQQHRQAGLHHHETGRVMHPGQGRYLLLQRRRPVDVHPSPTMISHRRIRPIRRQRQPLGQPGQRLLPITQLPRDRTVRVLEITELRPLPQRVIDVLHRQRHPIRNPPGAAGGVGGGQVAQQRIQRRTIRSNMMGHRHQHMLVQAVPEKRCTQWYFGGEIKGMTCRGIDGLLHPCRRPAGGVNHPPADVGLVGGDHDLVRCAVGDGEDGTQALVPGDHVGQRGAQRRNIKRPL